MELGPNGSNSPLVQPRETFNTLVMLLLASYDIVFQEVPGEVTLALNLSGCPNRCPGCHSPHLREAVGEPLDDELLTGLLARYGNSATCVAFMGGDGEPAEVNRLAALIHDTANLKTAWYSGRAELSPAIELANFDFIKLGPYDPERGGLDSPDTTNQRFYRIEACNAVSGTPATDEDAPAVPTIRKDSPTDPTAAASTSVIPATAPVSGEGTSASSGFKMIDATELFRKKSLI